LLIAVVYCRVSTEEQGRRGFSLPEQRRECHARAEAIATARSAHLQIIDFEDQASGEILERPGLEACRDYLARSRADLFICLDPDRFSRSLSLQLLVADEIEARGTELVFISHEYRRTPEGKLFFQLRGAISEFEKAKILERTRRGRRGKLALGGIPNYISTWGYRWNTVTKSPEVDEAAAPWVRQIFAWYAAGWSYQRIAEKLTTLGVRPARGACWHRTSIMRMIRNETYAGRLVLNRWDCEGNGPLRSIPKERRTRPRTDRRKPKDEWVTVQVPAIIDGDLWERAQAAHAGRTRLMQRGVAPLSGLCICGLCGAPLHYMGHPHRRYFRCRNRYPRLLSRPDRPTTPCNWRDVRAEPIEAAIWQVATQKLPCPAPPHQEPELPPAAAILERELAARRTEQQRAFHLFTRGLAPAGAERELERLAGQVESLQRELARLRSAPPASAPSCPPAGPDPAEMTPAQQRDFIRRVIRQVVIWPDGRYQHVTR